MSEEDARRRLMEKLQMVYSMGHGDGMSGGKGTKAGAKENAFIKYLKKNHTRAGYKPKKAGTKKVGRPKKSATKKVGRPRKVGRPKKTATKAMSKTATKTKKATKKTRIPANKGKHCACHGEVILRNGKLGEKCMYYDKPSCTAFEALSKIEAKKIKPKFLTQAEAKKYRKLHGLGLSGGCDTCMGEGGVLIDDYEGGILVGDEEYYSS